MSDKLTPTKPIHPQAMSIAQGRPLTNMQQRFVAEILADGSSATKAAIRAGYAVGTAAHQGWLLMKDPRVQAFIQEARDKATDTLGLSAERVIQELWKIAGANPGDSIVISEDGTIDLDSKGPGEVAVTNIDSKNGKAKSVTTKTVKPADKVAALTQIAKIMNLFPEKEKNEVKVTLSLTELIEKSMESKENPDGTPQEIELEVDDKAA